MTIANALTSLRLALIPVGIGLFILGYPLGSFAVFVLAELTDVVDGWVARKLDQCTVMGSILDPLADKLLVLSYMAVFLREIYPLWLFLLVLAREVAVLAARCFVIGQGQNVEHFTSGRPKGIIMALSLLFAFMTILPFGIGLGEEQRQIAFWLMLLGFAVSVIPSQCIWRRFMKPLGRYMRSSGD